MLGANDEFYRESWRSTLYMMTGLSALAFLGGYFTMDPDVLDMTQDRYVITPSSPHSSSIIFLL